MTGETAHAPNYGFDLSGLELVVDATTRVVEVRGAVVLMPGKTPAQEYVVCTCDGVERLPRAEQDAYFAVLPFAPLRFPRVAASELDLLGERLASRPSRAIVLRARGKASHVHGLIRLEFRPPP